MANIKVDISELNKFTAQVKNTALEFNKNTKVAIRNSALNIKKEASNNLKNNKSVVTGHLRRSIATNIQDFSAEIGTNVKYGICVEEGTKSHLIKPKKGKFLYWKGAKHPVKFVKHPGSKAKPFLEPAFKNEVPILLKNIEESIKW